MTCDYSISQARYAKGKMAVRCPSSTGMKTRAARLAGAICRHRYTHREGAYIMSTSQAQRFEALYLQGYDACVITDKIEPPRPDLRFSNCGSFATMAPVTDRGRQWAEENIDAEQFPVPIEFRFLEDIVVGAREAGLICVGCPTQSTASINREEEDRTCGGVGMRRSGSRKAATHTTGRNIGSAPPAHAMERATFNSAIVPTYERNP